MSLPRLAVLCDFYEENWPSMNLVADMLLLHLEKDHAGVIAPTRICPPMRRRFTRRKAASGKLFNADRLLNRFWDYPRLVRVRKAEFDLFSRGRSQLWTALASTAARADPSLPVTTRIPFNAYWVPRLNLDRSSLREWSSAF